MAREFEIGIISENYYTRTNAQNKEKKQSKKHGRNPLALVYRDPLYLQPPKFLLLPSTHV
jgi:hypothetical protein